MSLDLFVYTPELPKDIEERWANSFRAHTQCDVLAGADNALASDHGPEFALRLPANEAEFDDWQGLLVSPTALSADQRYELMKLAESELVRQILATSKFEIHFSAESGVGDVSFFDVFWGVASLAEAANGVFHDPQEGGLMTGRDSIKWVRDFIALYPNTFKT
jgi:hypothetical protein